MSKKSEIKVECENCGRVTPHAEHGRVNETEVIDWDIEGQDVHDVIEWCTVLLQCEVCEKVSLWGSSNFDEEYSQMYPAIKDLDGVPVEIQSSYLEARKVRNVSPVAFAVLIRRALEYLCNDQNAVGRDLKSKLKNLSDRGIIPSTLSRMSNAIRYFGNLGAHASESKIEKEETRIMDDFFIAVVEYVYIAPEKLKRAERKIKK